MLEAVSGGDLEQPFQLQIMYGIGGERDLTERTLDHLSGYRGSRPVRVGNGAWDQHQNDVWGMLLDAVDTHLHQGQAPQIVRQVWEGLAELRRRTPSHTATTPTRASGRSGGTPSTSRLPRCCAGWPPTGAATWPGHGATPSGPSAGSKAADEMKAEILDKGVDERGRFRQHYANDELDASLLLIPILGFLPPTTSGSRPRSWPSPTS